ncbi:MAG: hypothetical protein LUE99_04955 [Bacteroides sp.]|nr:hypothetical protein [Bacteroides sp.]
MIYKSTPIYTFLFVFPPASYGAFFDKDIHLLTIQNGLADNTVNCIYKDWDGFMWFGSENGISRYDGKNIRNFGKEKIYLSISEITEISDYCMGIVANYFLSCFNRKTETFIPIVNAADSSAVRALHLLSAENDFLWVLTDKKLILYKQTEIYDKRGRVASIVLRMEKEYTYLLEEDGERFSVFLLFFG